MKTTETCSGIESNPDAFISLGSIPSAPIGHSCRWFRIGRIRFGWYGGRIYRAFLARYDTGWQLTAFNAFISWTY